MTENVSAQTGDERDPGERTRVDDPRKARCTRLLTWWHRWKDLVIAAVLLPTAIVCGVLAVRVYSLSSERARDAAVVRVIVEQQAIQQRAVAAQQKATAIAAKSNCQRTRQYGPAFADYFESVGVFTAKDAAAYRQSIPKTCPK